MAAIKLKKKNMALTSLTGQTLGKYRIIEPLGRGGMAQVYKAYHPQLDRYVAVKVLRSDLVEEKEFLARFSREARAVAGLRHPNIVQVYDFDMQDGLYYMVMELLEGDTLKAHLNVLRTSDEQLPRGEILRILNDVFAGLGYAHGEGIIHRDLKPANIMLTRHGQAVLTDFGIAQIVGATQYTVSGALMGTLNYMAPEQGLSGQCDTRSDIYSLGIVYYEMLTGKVPFDADTPLAILMKHINDPLPLPRKYDPSIPEPLERVALKALAKQPEDRFQNVAEMFRALQEAAGKAGIEVPEAISLPMPAARQASPSEPIAVFSGTSREHISDRDFAAGDTDSNLREKLERERQGLLDLETIPGKIDTTAFRTLFKPPTIITEEQIRPRYASQAAIASVLVLIFTNMCALWASGIFGWKTFGRAWPLELLAVGILLSSLMAALASPWLLIPSGIVLGNGLILAYCSLTGWWSHWVFLWPLEPLIVAASILGAFWLAKHRKAGHWASRRVGLIMLIVSFFALMGLIIAAGAITYLSGALPPKA